MRRCQMSGLCVAERTVRYWCLSRSSIKHEKKIVLAFHSSLLYQSLSLGGRAGLLRHQIARRDQQAKKPQLLPPQVVLGYHTVEEPGPPCAHQLARWQVRRLKVQIP